jgi:hypothetical protein
MKVALSIMVFFLGTTIGFSQKNEFLKKKAFPITPSKKIEAPKPEKPEPKPENPFTGIAPVNPKVTDDKPAENSNPFSNPAPMMPSKSIGTSKPISMQNKNPFVNSGDKIVEKLNNKLRSQEGNPNIDYSVFRKNESFGEFRTKSTFVTLSCKDHGEIDGDRISVYVNGKMYIEQITLQYDFQQINVNLVKGINKIDFVMLNEGYSSPNTTQYIILDDQNKVISGQVYALATGFKASIIIVRE